MKKIFVLIFIVITTVSFASDKPFLIDSSIHNNSTLKFIPHHGSGPWGSYLTMDINFEPMANLFRDLLIKKKSQLASRGEAHITVITPIEYHQVLRNKVSMEEIDEIALRHDIQSSEFDIVCLGRGTATVDNKKEGRFTWWLSLIDCLKLDKKSKSFMLIEVVM